MLAMSKPSMTTAAVLLSCLLFLDMGKTPAGVATAQTLRGSANNEGLEEVAIPAQGQRVLFKLPPTTLKAGVGENVAHETAEASEPVADEDVENAVFSWPEQDAETNGFWGPDNQERAQLAQFIGQGTWDRLDEVDEPTSFSFDL